MDIDQQVMDAFQIEHQEQLQRIRALLLDLECNNSATRSHCLDEAFRMAHSLKGGARVCDLRPAEMLGHGLETMFSRVREGTLDLNDQVIRSINVVLDGIEDWMAALLQNATPPDPIEALRAIENLLQQDGASGATCILSPINDDVEGIEQQLHAAFYREYRSYTDGLNAFLKRCGKAATGDPHEFDEAFYLAHDLRASARAARLSEVERLADPLEASFRRLRDGTLEFNAEVHKIVQTALRDIDRHITDSRETSEDPLTACPPGAAENIPPSAEKPTTEGEAVRSAVTPERQIETVRVRADSLDRLLQSSSQLLTESLRQDQVTRELGELKHAIEVMQRERELLRRVASASLHRLEETPELRHLSRYFESVERNLHVLSQNTRKLHVKQQRSCWALRSHGLRIQKDIRQARMVSAHSLFQAFPKMVRDLARDEQKQVEFKVLGSDVRADRMVLQALKDPVMHMLRNAVTHGIELPHQRTHQGKPAQGRIHLVVKAVGNRLQITIQDDGSGINLSRVAEVAARNRSAADPIAPTLSQEELTRLIFEPGFSTSASVTELAGRGMGLSVVHETVKRLQGSVQLLDEGPGTTIVLSVPLSVCTHRLLLIASGEQKFAVPLHAIERLVRIKIDEIEALEGAPVVMHRNQLVPLTSLAALVGLKEDCIAGTGDAVPALIMKLGSRRLAVVVDEFLEERDALVQSLDAPSARPEFSGAIITEDGGAILVLNPAQLFECEQPRSGPLNTTPQTLQPKKRAMRVLVVDDSFTTRTLEKSILETHGYQVHVATDGVEAMAKLQSHPFDAVISDLEMPRLDGFGLLEEMKKQPKFASIPVILVTSRDCLEDQKRGLELGAEAYIVKRKFDHQDLLNTIEQVIAS